MSVDLTPELTTAQEKTFLATLSQAAIAVQDPSSQHPRPAAKAMVQALVQAEKAAKQQRLAYSLEALAGTWKLCFSTSRSAHEKAGVVVGRGFYMPWFTPAYISFAPQASEPGEVMKGEIGNQIQMGPLLLKLTGLFQYLTKKNLLAFEFAHMQISIAGKPIYSGDFRGGKALAETFYSLAIAKLPFFAFFLVTDDLIAARGRGGGLAMWVRDDECLSESTSIYPAQGQ